MPAEKELIQQAQLGDRAAFVVIIDSHYDMIFHIALKYTGVKADAEDITQLTCIKLARTIKQFRFESAFSTWLYRLVINCANDWIKSQKRHQHHGEPSPQQDAVAGNQEQGIYLQQVLHFIELMGDGYKDVVILTIGEGLSHGEAAEVLGIKESTVSWRLHEVRKRLGHIDQSEGNQ